MDFGEEEALPPVTRRRRGSEEMDELVEALDSGKIMSIRNVEKADVMKLSMRVRGAAKRHGFAISHRYSPTEKKLYLHRVDD